MPVLSSMFDLLIRLQPRSTLFHDTTIFRSRRQSKQNTGQKRRAGRESRDSPVGRQVWSRRNTDRKSTRLNSSHLGISYAVFCLKKKTNKDMTLMPKMSRPIITTIEQITYYD